MDTFWIKRKIKEDMFAKNVMKNVKLVKLILINVLLVQMEELYKVGNVKRITRLK